MNYSKKENTMNDFYKSCAVPKPVDKKKKKKVNGWKDKKNRICAICGEPYAERHELFGGANRQTSIELGFQVDLCRSCHRAFHQRDPEWMPIIIGFKRAAQSGYEKKLTDSGISAEKTRELWMQLIGRNYLTEDEDG